LPASGIETGLHLDLTQGMDVHDVEARIILYHGARSRDAFKKTVLMSVPMPTNKTGAELGMDEVVSNRHQL
jgi:hypothetical protein